MHHSSERHGKCLWHTVYGIGLLTYLTSSPPIPHDEVSNLHTPCWPPPSIALRGTMSAVRDIFLSIKTQSSYTILFLVHLCPMGTQYTTNTRLRKDKEMKLIETEWAATIVFSSLYFLGNSNQTMAAFRNFKMGGWTGRAVGGGILIGIFLRSFYIALCLCYVMSCWFYLWLWHTTWDGYEQIEWNGTGSRKVVTSTSCHVYARQQHLDFSIGTMDMKMNCYYHEYNEWDAFGTMNDITIKTPLNSNLISCLFAMSSRCEGRNLAVSQSEHVRKHLAFFFNLSSIILIHHWSFIIKLESIWTSLSSALFNCRLIES